MNNPSSDLSTAEVRLHSGEAMSRKVGEFIEPLTRFDKDQLRLKSCNDSTAPIHIVQAYQATFSSTEEDGFGSLPSDSERVSGPDQLAAELASRMTDTKHVAMRRLASWEKEHGSDPHAAPSLGDVFTRSNPVGYEKQCGGCRGRGQQDCSTCRASGKTNCTTCGGQGKSSCSGCHGSGQANCGSCQGRGGSSRQVEVPGWNYASNQKTVSYRTVWEPCIRCGGRKTEVCFACGGTGRKTCYGCNGTGSVTCTRCGGRRSVTCNDCQGKGKLHHLGNISGSVAASFSLNLDTEMDEVRSDLSSLTTVDQVLPLVEDYQASTGIDGLQLERRLSADVAVASADFEVGGGRLTIHGYGPDCEIFNYRNIGGMLLSEDVGALETAISERSGLLPALARLFQSEAYVKIAHQSGAMSGKGRTAALGELADNLRGFASYDYVERVSKATRNGLSRAYFTSLKQGPLFFLATPLLALPVNWMAWRYGFRHHDLGIIVGVMLLTIGLAFLGHLQVGKQLQGALSPDKAVNVSEILKRTGVLRKWLVTTAVAALILTPVFGAMGRAWAGF